MTAMEPQIMELETGARSSDEALMLAYAAGNAGSFEELYNRHKKSVYAFIRRFIRGNEPVDDVFQMVFMRLVRNREKYQPNARFTTWLFTITRSVCIDELRKRTRERSRLCETDDLEPDANVVHLHTSDGGAREASYRNQVRNVIDRIVQQLPDEQREVFLLREHTGMTFEEIGELTGCAPNTAKSRMHYALHALRRGLQQRGIEP